MKKNISETKKNQTKLWLNKNKKKDLLKFLTCGSVDDGKSTLIGRLLHDTKQIYVDQLKLIKNYSKKYKTDKDSLDLSLLVDGLQSEREQGITIDVAYRYFNTEKRHFIIADTPGHEQYTRNMATGASNCDLAIILIDARKGLLNQTKRHSFIVTLLGIKKLIVAINKMDLINYEKNVFDQIKKDFINFAVQLPKNVEIIFIPISAVLGINVVSSGISWYKGDSILKTIENIDLKNNTSLKKIRFPVQYIIRNNKDFRGYAGTLESGKLYIGQKIKVLPSNIKSTISNIIFFNKKIKKVQPGQTATIILKDNIDISRGDILVSATEHTSLTQFSSLYIVWMDEKPLIEGNTYIVKIAGKQTTVSIKKINYQIDVNNLTKKSINILKLNDIGLIDIFFTEKVFLDLYKDNKITGGIIFIDKINNNTVGAGMIKSINYKDKDDKLKLNNFELELHNLITRYFPHWQIKKTLK